MTANEGGSFPRVAVINLVGLCRRHLGKDMPRITKFSQKNDTQEQLIRPAFPALTCSAQATYLTGTLPSEHGIVGNGWYDRNLNEHQFWKQSNALVKGDKVWDVIKEKRPGFTCAKLFWWYNMYSSADYSITPRPLYGSDGDKQFDIHTHPMEIRDDIKKELGAFPFPSFWGPMAGIASSQWIADSARWIEEKHSPDLSLVYLPHLDYDLQRHGPKDPKIKKALHEIDEVAGDLIDYFENKGVTPIILSEYGITEVNKVIYPNREFRHQGWLSIKEEFGKETLDCGGSDAFALTDHQVAHIYIKNECPEIRKEIRASLEAMDGVSQVLEGRTRKEAGLDHDRAGDLIALSEEDAWFAYYHWDDDTKAPEFARCIDIHRKYGYDPAELFFDPKLTSPKLRAARKLIAKKLGFRVHMDLIPLDATLVRGSHGVVPKDKADWPILCGAANQNADSVLEPTDIFSVIQKALLS
ncbi:MAG: alkaline phosphatase family protein [Opitutales bacterium]|nr:alkaline phosphatase family protein [Opitutales bacterium]